MTAPEGRRAQAQVGSLQTTDAYLRVAGREFLVQFYTALRSLKLYPLENPVVQKALDDLVTTADQIIQREEEIEIRVTGEFIFVNSTRLRLDLDNYASFSHVLSVLRTIDIGVVRGEAGADRREWTSFLSLLLTTAARDQADNRFYELTGRMREAGVTHIIVEPPLESEGEVADEARNK